MPAPVVTVLLPARNAEPTVARAVECLLEGTLRPVRVLAVDDGSTDGTRSVLQRLAARDARVELLEGQGRGLVAALQLGLSHATSPYVARMDADDEALPRRLEASVEALEADSHLGGERGVTVERFVDVHPRKVGTRVQGIPVVAPEQLGPPGPGLLIVCVGVPWAREEIRADLTSRGYVEGVSFLCAA